MYSRALYMCILEIADRAPAECCSEEKKPNKRVQAPLDNQHSSATWTASRGTNSIRCRCAHLHKPVLESRSIFSLPVYVRYRTVSFSPLDAIYFNKFISRIHSFSSMKSARTQASVSAYLSLYCFTHLRELAYHRE